MKLRRKRNPPSTHDNTDNDILEFHPLPDSIPKLEDSSLPSQVEQEHHLPLLPLHPHPLLQLEYQQQPPLQPSLEKPQGEPGSEVSYDEEQREIKMKEAQPANPCREKR